MRWGMVSVRFGAGAQVSAPASGIRLGTAAGSGHDEPVLLRLFRVSGTRMVVIGEPLAAQLIAIRAAAAGTPVQVVTRRPDVWRPLLRYDTSTHLVTDREIRQMPGGPTLLVDDRQRDGGRLGGGGLGGGGLGGGGLGGGGLGGTRTEVAPWQCRIEVRPTWQAPELRAFARADLALFGGTAEDATPRIAMAFALPVHAVHGLARLDGVTFALLRRGRIEYVTVDPSEAENRVLQQAGGQRAERASRH